MNASNINFTSLDYYINNFSDKISEDVFNLDLIARNFELSDKFDRLEYSEKKGKGSIEKLINRPPIGPIPLNFKCTFCEEIGPDFHKIECPNPSKRSLVLTYKGFKALLRDREYSGPLEEDIKKYKIGNNSTKLSILEKYFADDIEKVKEDGKTKIKIPDEAFSNVTYDEVVKIKGRDPQGPKTLTVRFSNMVSIFYTYEDKTTNIRIYKDGSIDIKNMSQEKNFIQELINRINKTNGLIVNNYKKLLNKNKQPITNKYTLNDTFSYYYLYHAQFYMFGKESKKSLEVNFDELENVLEVDEDNEYVNIFEDEVFLKIDDMDFTIIPKSAKDKKLIKESTDSKVYLIDVDDITITLFITKYGVFQFTVSSQNITVEECEEILSILRDYFIDIFKNDKFSVKTYITPDTTIYDMQGPQLTTVSGLTPPKSESQRTGTEICRKTQAGVALRPNPYSWTGNCAAENYAPAIGINKKYKGGDIKVNYNGKEQQLYYPCCEKLVGNDRRIFIEKLKTGFTPEEQEEYGIFPNKDILSGVIIPGSTVKGAKSSVLLPGETDYSDVEVISVPSKITSTAKYKVKRLSDSQEFTIERSAFKRDSRYFRGLNSLSKQELINILIKENKVTQGLKIDTLEYKNKLNFKYISLSALREEFTKNIYKATYVPDNTNLVILEYNDKNDQFYVDINANVKIESNVNFIDGTKIVGYLHESSREFYPIYIIGLNLEESRDLIDTNLNSAKDTIQSVDFIDNYIEASNFYLKEYSNIRILFVPEELNLTIYYYDENLIPLPTTVQIIDRIDTSNYIFGYDNISFHSNIYKLVIPQTVKKQDYIQIHGNYNKITGNVDKNKPIVYIKKVNKETKSYEKAKLQFFELLTPIDIQFFTLSDEYIIIGGEKYNYDIDTQKLSPM